MARKSNHRGEPIGFRWFYALIDWERTPEARATRCYVEGEKKEVKRVSLSKAIACAAGMLRYANADGTSLWVGQRRLAKEYEVKEAAIVMFRRRWRGAGFLRYVGIGPGSAAEFVLTLPASVYGDALGESGGALRASGDAHSDAPADAPSDALADDPRGSNLRTSGPSGPPERGAVEPPPPSLSSSVKAEHVFRFSIADLEAHARKCKATPRDMGDGFKLALNSLSDLHEEHYKVLPAWGPRECGQLRQVLGYARTAIDSTDTEAIVREVMRRAEIMYDLPADDHWLKRDGNVHIGILCTHWDKLAAPPSAKKSSPEWKPAKPERWWRPKREIGLISSPTSPFEQVEAVQPRIVVEPGGIL